MIYAGVLSPGAHTYSSSIHAGPPRPRWHTFLAYAFGATSSVVAHFPRLCVRGHLDRCGSCCSAMRSGPPRPWWHMLLVYAFGATSTVVAHGVWHCSVRALSCRVREVGARVIQFCCVLLVVGRVVICYEFEWSGIAADEAPSRVMGAQHMVGEKRERWSDALCLMLCV